MPWVQSNDLHTRVAPHDKSSTPATLTPTTPLHTWCSSKFLLVTIFSTVLCFMFVFLGKFSLSMSRGILYMTSNTSATPNSGPPVKIGNLLEFWRRSMVYGVQCCLHNLSKPNRPICVKSKDMTSKFWITRICLKRMTSYWWTWTFSRQSYIHRRKANHDLACILSSMKSGEKMKRNWHIEHNMSLVATSCVWSENVWQLKWRQPTIWFQAIDRTIAQQSHNRTTIVQQPHNCTKVQQSYNHHHLLCTMSTTDKLIAPPWSSPLS